MVSGLLNKLIILEHLDSATNNFGEEETLSYIPYCRTKAQVYFSNDSKIQIGDEITFVNEVTFNIRFYHLKTLQKTDRILYLNQHYDILEIQPNEDLRMITIKAKSHNE